MHQGPRTVVIFAQSLHQGQQFFVLLATDRQLNITHAGAIDTTDFKAAQTASRYAAFVGQSVERLHTEPGDDAVQAAVDRAVLKAATMLLVRLKSG